MEDAAKNQVGKEPDAENKTYMQVMSSCTFAILFPLSPVEAACYRGL